jgi:hypothetical protein
VDTQTRYPRRVPRPPWTPDDDQKKLLAALKRAHAKMGDAEAEYKRLLAECAAADIPVARLADTVEVERKTIYRHLGRSMT